MLRHRGQRVLLPWVLALLTVCPALQWAFWVGRRLVGHSPNPVPDGLGARWPLADISMGHLWFLWLLCWLVAGFAALVAAGRWLQRTRPGFARTLHHRGAFVVAMLGLSLVAQYAMADSHFGPRYTDQVLLDPVVVGYYGCFFAVGAACHRPGDTVEPLVVRLRRQWPLVGGAAVVCAVVGDRLADDHQVVARVPQVLLAWLTLIALLGIFHRLFGGERGADPRVRWLSDASYWTYLVHFPVVLALQGVLARTGLPWWAVMPLVLAATTVVCLVSYQYLVRYTVIGRLLNGPRSRPGTLLA